MGVDALDQPWSPAKLARLVAELQAAEGALAAVPTPDLAAAWGGTVEAFLDSSSPERRRIEGPLAGLCRLSQSGLGAALEAVLGGVRRRHAEEVFRLAGERMGEGARSGAARPPASGGGPVLVVLASNLPALAVQPLLPILAARRPVLLKSPSAEPLFAPAFLAALVQREPRLAGAVAAAAWPGGAADLEAPVLAGCSTVLAYGGDAAIADLAARAPGKVVGYGPKTSLAVVGGQGRAGWRFPDRDAEAKPGAREEADGWLRGVAAGLARDVALFDQRGCLSIAAVYVAGPPGNAVALARLLATELAELALRWPPGPAGAAGVAEQAAVQQLRLEAEMRGLEAPSLPVAAGTVVVEPEPGFQASPGLRTVRVHPLPDLARLPLLLAPWRGRLQGAALAGEEAWRLRDDLAALGLSRFAPPGELQSPTAAWHSGGVDPLALLLPDRP
jgi:hypothetical protein